MNYYMCELCFCEFTSLGQIGSHLQRQHKISAPQWADYYLELPRDIAYAKWFSKKRKNLIKEKFKHDLINKPNKIKKKPAPVDFFKSREWRELRYKVLAKYGSICMSCGRSPKVHGIIIHVDHIKPRIKYPKLELDEDNLQILCEDCNQGKSYIDETDWRK